MFDMLFLVIVLALCMFFMHRMHSGTGRSSGHSHGLSKTADAQSGTGKHHMLWMVVVCVLPLFLFFVLMSNGIVINSWFFVVFFFVGCIAMFFFMDRGMNDEGEEREEDSTPDEKLLADVNARLEGLFQIRSHRVQGDIILIEGTPVVAAEQALDLLNARFADTNLTPLFQENDAGEPVVALLPERQELSQQERRSPKIHLLLFVLTLITTTWAGAAHLGIDLLRNPGQWTAGLPYALGLMAILGLHEFGHYALARKHHMSVTLPYFIPVPFALGTFGAFIRMRSTPQNRRALFDVGVAGPLAGLAVAIPALVIGLQFSTPVLGSGDAVPGGVNVGSSLLLAFLTKLALGDLITEGHQLVLHPLAFAGWLGLLVTALNLLPIGQLDGGHIAHALFGRKRSDTIGTVALFSMFLLAVFVWRGLLTWAIIVFLIAGTKSAPPLDDVTRLDDRRVAIGAFAFVVLFLILMPVPHALYSMLGFQCPYI